MERKSFEKRKNFVTKMKQYWLYYVLFLPGALVLLLFNYIPMAGYVLAFKDFWPEYGMFFSPWETPLLKNFTTLFEDAYFWKTVQNTLVIFFLKFTIISKPTASNTF